MRIALCDIDSNFLKILKRLIYIYAEHFKLDILVDCYTSGENLLNSGIEYNLVFLEYKLNGITGLETAKKIRNLNLDITIIFISEYTEFVFESFKVFPYRFLVKPIKQNLLFETLNEYFKKTGNDYPLWIKSANDTVYLNTKEIYYIEANNKHCLIHLKNEVLYCNRTMAKVFEILPKNHFLKINRAFIINMNFIERYNNQELILLNKKSLRISRNYFKIFKEEYRRFITPLEP